jgi:hypothetical protein
MGEWIKKNTIGLVIVLAMLITVAVGAVTMQKQQDISTIDNIIYKAIELSSNPARYYVIDKDGNVYKISQEDWADLEVPVLSK